MGFWTCDFSGSLSLCEWECYLAGESERGRQVLRNRKIEPLLILLTEWQRKNKGTHACKIAGSSEDKIHTRLPFTGITQKIWQKYYTLPDSLFFPQESRRQGGGKKTGSTTNKWPLVPKSRAKILGHFTGCGWVFAISFLFCLFVFYCWV